MAKSVKLADIAEKFNVSTVTISKALSNQKGVSEELRQKIKKVADEMGYRQPSVIRKETYNQSFNIGVIVSEIFLDKYDSFYWHMYQAITTEAVSHGSFTLLEVINKVMENKLILPKLLQEQKVDGIIIIGRMEKTYLNLMNEKAGVPLVYLDFYDEHQTCSSVISNSFFGSYVLTNYLFDMGHTKIGYVGTLLATESITDRYFGYAKSLMEHGIVVNQNWLINDREFHEAKINIDYTKLIQEDMPTAFVCNCDLTASHVIRILQEHGYRVPEDISIVGFDNYLYPGMCSIGITTYEVDTVEMAKQAIISIIKKITSNKDESGIYIVQGYTVIKDSVRKIN